MFGWIILGIIVVAIGYGITAYNNLVRQRQLSQEGWSGIDVQLKRRTDLIPNLMEAVKGYMAHERDTLEAVTKARTAGLRKLATRKLFDEALNVLRGKARVKRTMWSRRAQEYEAKINSGDPLAIAEVVRDLHRNAGQPDQSFSERQIYEAAMDRLAAELGALDKTDKQTAVTKLTDFLKTV